MNRAMIKYSLGKMLQIESILLLLPFAIALYYNDLGKIPFLLSIIISFLIGSLLSYKKPTNQVIYAKEGFALVALAWLALSLFGALPFYFSQEIPNYFDAFFETVSGFTTTGASILNAVEDLSLSLIFWRSFTHWVGGMGVLVFALAIIPLAENRSMHLMRAEVPGPSAGKILPKMKDTAKILYLIYFGLTLIEVLLLKLGGMSFFDSLVHSFGTAGTGGFSSRNLSIGYYQSAYFEWVIGIFMVLFGINFNLYFYLLTRKFKPIFKNEELKLYLLVIGLATLAITINILPVINQLFPSVRTAFFQVASIITTTGYSSLDFNLWPAFSKVILILLMFIGASAGSTGGGIKVSRFIIFGRLIKKEIKRLIHPRSIEAIKLEDKTLSEENLSGVSSYMLVYMAIFVVSLLLIALERVDFETNFTSVATCLNNVGPGFGLVGPMNNFGFYSNFSKVLLSFNMLLGRLEIFPILLIFVPGFWKRK